MGGNLALVEYDASLRIYAGGKERRGHFPSVGFKFFGVLPNGDRMQIDYAVDALVIILQTHEISDRTKVIAEMKVPARLHAREYPVHLIVPVIGNAAGYRVNAKSGQASA